MTMAVEEALNPNKPKTGLPAMWNLSHMRDEGLPRSGFEPTAVKDLLTSSRTPRRLGHRGPPLAMYRRISLHHLSLMFVISYISK